MAEFVSFKAAADAMAMDLKKEYREAFAFAGVVALSRAAVAARDMIKTDMKHVFDRPTPYALNAARAKPATKHLPESAVLLRDFGGTPAENYLGPEIEGGDRRAKRFEKALRAKGILPAGMFAVPGKAATIDQKYGNQSASEIVQILSALQAFAEVGYIANRVTKQKLAKRAKRQPKFFVAKSNRTGDPLGIYKVVSKGKVAPVMIFTRSPHYTERFDFYGLARQHAEAVFPALLDAALTEFGPK